MRAAFADDRLIPYFFYGLLIRIKGLWTPFHVPEVRFPFLTVPDNYVIAMTAGAIINDF